MQADTGYDTTKFEALRRELLTLNKGALADGLVAVQDGAVVIPKRPRRAARRKSAGPAKAAAGAKGKPKATKKTEKRPDRSPDAARRLLALMSRRDGDESLDLPGTAFTEAGVTRLLAHLRGRRSKRGGGAWIRFLQRADRYLQRPVPAGNRTVQGVGFERLQIVARQLAEIETGGWARFHESHAVRRRKVVPTPPLTQDAASAGPRATGHVEPAGPRRKGTSR